MTRHKKNSLPPPPPSTPLRRRDGAGLTCALPIQQQLPGHKTRLAGDKILKPLTLTLLLGLTLPVQGKSCGSVTYKGKKTSISCSIALPNGKRKTPPPAAKNSIIPPIQLPGDPPPAAITLPMAETATTPTGSGRCYATLTINGQKRRIRQHCPLLPLAPITIHEPGGEFKARQEAHKALINQLAAKYQIDPALVHAVISVESAYKSDAVSHKGAVGLMQLMPGTADEMNITDPYNPANNIEGGIKYLSQQLKRYQNTELALAAYNAGPGNLSRYGGQIPPFNETRHYVKRVMIYKDRYQNDWQQHIK